MDAIVFVTDVPGRHQVTDPLHPEMTAWVNVFQVSRTHGTEVRRRLDERIG